MVNLLKCRSLCSCQRGLKLKVYRLCLSLRFLMGIFSGSSSDGYEIDVDFMLDSAVSDILAFSSVILL